MSAFGVNSVWTKVMTVGPEREVEMRLNSELYQSTYCISIIDFHMPCNPCILQFSWNMSCFLVAFLQLIPFIWTPFEFFTAYPSNLNHMSHLPGSFIQQSLFAVSMIFDISILALINYVYSVIFLFLRSRWLSSFSYYTYSRVCPPPNKVLASVIWLIE